MRRENDDFVWQSAEPLVKGMVKDAALCSDVTTEVGAADTSNEDRVARQQMTATDEKRGRAGCMSRRLHDAYSEGSGVVIAQANLLAIPDRGNRMLQLATVANRYEIAGAAQAGEFGAAAEAVSYTHLRAHETDS